MLDQDAQRKGRLAVGGDGVDEFACGRAVVRDAIHFIETVLINVAIRGGVGFYSADSIGARHARIIEGETRKVNAAEREVQSGRQEQEKISERNFCGASGHCAFCMENRKEERPRKGKLLWKRDLGQRERIEHDLPREEVHVFMIGQPGKQFHIVGWSQGTFPHSLNVRTGKETVTQDSADVPVFDPQTSKFTKAGMKGLRMDRFLERLETEIRRQALGEIKVEGKPSGGGGDHPTAAEN